MIWKLVVVAEDCSRQIAGVPQADGEKARSGFSDDLGVEPAP